VNPDLATLTPDEQKFQVLFKRPVALLIHQNNLSKPKEWNSK